MSGADSSLAAEVSKEEEYLAGSGLVLPEGMSRAEAVAALRRVAEEESRCFGRGG